MSEQRYACEFGGGSPYGSSLYEEGSAHLPGFISVYSSGKCGGDSDFVCAACFLQYVQPATDQNGAGWDRGRWIKGDTVSVLLDGQMQSVTVDEAIEVAKGLVGEQIVRHA